MKQLFKILLVAWILPFIVSCEDFMDIHKDFIKDGEIIYAPRVYGWGFVAGNNRIGFAYLLYNSPNVKTVDIYWNDRTDSLIIPVSPTTGFDTLFTVIPNLEEKSYTFDFRTTDNFGHKSLFSTDFGTAYGTNFESTLSQRRINAISIEEVNNQPSGIITFYAAGTGLVRTEYRFQKTDGSTGTLALQPDQNRIVCPLAKPGSNFEYRSLYIPEEFAIDTFATAWETYTTPFPLVDMYRYDRSAWTVVDVSDERVDDGGGRNTVLDNNLGSYWHSQWGPDVDVPHWIIIDMKTAKNIVKFDMYRRPGNTDTKTVECYLGNSDDADGAWTKIGEGEYPNGAKDLIEIIPTDIVTKGRYLKLVLPNSYRGPYTNIAEVYPYGGF